MKYKFFAIPARYPEETEDALNRFCSQHRVSFVEKHLVTDGANSFWSVCVTWLEGGEAISAGSHKKSSIDYKQILNENEFSVFLELRNLSFVGCNNRRALHRLRRIYGAMHFAY